MGTDPGLGQEAGCQVGEDKEGIGAGRWRLCLNPIPRFSGEA